MTASIEHSVDWLQYSVEWPTAVKEWPVSQRAENAIVQTAIPMIAREFDPPQRASDSKIFGMQGYSKTYDLLYATAHVNPNRREQKIGVRMTGEELRAYRSMGGSDARLIEFIRNTKAKPTRLDLALDIRGYNVDPMRVYRDWRDGKVVCRARKVKPYTESTREPDGSITDASTLYFGSRQSEIMMRLYDKGAQMKTGEDWVRLEAEIKGDRAIAIADDCYRLGIRLTTVQVMRDFFTAMPYKFWRQIANGNVAELTPVPRKRTARDAWLFEIIIPLLRQEIWSEWEGMEERGITSAIEALIGEHWRTRAEYHRAMSHLVSTRNREVANIETSE